MKAEGRLGANTVAVRVGGCSQSYGEVGGGRNEGCERRANNTLVVGSAIHRNMGPRGPVQ